MSITMKKNERPTFAKNLTKARKANGWNQTKAAHMLGIKLKTYQKYEEGVSLPALDTLATLVHIFGVTNIVSFLENPSYSFYHQDMEFTVNYESPLEKIYAAAPEKERQIVDIALGIGAKEVTC